MEEEKPQSQLEKIAKTIPVLPVISDNPLDEKTAFLDRFDLSYRLGPAFDIIRHPDTKLPTTIAVYGNWGTGKTTAMKWLQAAIEKWKEVGPEEWEQDGQTKKKTEIHHVWFYPWKYHDKEDIWRGLIAEIILETLKLEDIDKEKLIKAFKLLAAFVGKSALDILAANEFQIGPIKIKGAILKDIKKNFDRISHPEKAYLNQYENDFKHWAEDILGKQKRMVIFIDDLDRCMPDIALQVLEALKLYLNIESLVFVIGMDQNVLKKAVAAYYDKNKIEDVNPADYLAKMFQTEVTVEPSEKQILDYLNWHLERVEYWKDTKYLKKNEKDLFKRLITDQAQRNPREVKRLINSAIMSGAGAEMVAKAGLEEKKYSFKQGVQVFFIRRILDRDKYKDSLPHRFFGSNTANDFFGQWSKIVTKNKDIEKTVKIFYREPEKPIKEIGPAFNAGKTTPGPLKPQIDLQQTINQAPKPYKKLLKNKKFTTCIHLLEDIDLGDLMQIKYSEELAEKTRAVEEKPPLTDNDQIIRKAIAEQLGKKPDELTGFDYDNIQKLDLSETQVSDLGLISQLENLTDLDLSFTEVSNLGPISQLKDLTGLNFWYTQVSDLGPISQLKNLIRLNFNETQVIDLGPISQLEDLKELDLGYTEVSNLGPISQLKDLTELYFNGTEVSDLGPISQLKDLTKLGFWDTEVSDLGPISQLKNLTELYFGETKVSDLGPVSQLKNLAELDFRETQVSDLGLISQLKNLTSLHFGNTQVSDLGPVSQLTDLTDLYFWNTKVSDLDPISQLTDLTMLNFSETEVSDLGPISQLKNLTKLNFSRTEVSDLGPVSQLENLTELYIQGCKNIDKDQVKRLKDALSQLKIYT